MKWTIEDENFVIENYLLLTCAQIGSKLNRTRKSVIHKMHSLGLRKEFQKPVSKEELDLIRFLVESKNSHEEIALITNRTKTMIKGICERYKISIRHYQTKTRLYRTWKSMTERCRVNNKNYKIRGIIICKEWLVWENFRDWAHANGYQEHLEIDRINNDGNYCPENCKWSTRKEQNNNKRNNHYLTAFDETKTISQWSDDKRCVVSYTCLIQRIRRGMSPEIAIITPILKSRRV